MKEVDRSIVIGAGPAGLAIAACLSRRGIGSVVLEKGTVPGQSWVSHYDRLHLHTDSRRSSLPGFPFPRSAGKYPSRDDVVKYLRAYVEYHGLDVLYKHTVESVRPAAGGWSVATADGRQFESHTVVVATGYTAEPILPTWQGMAYFDGPIVHSADYRNGIPYAGKRVLVVGFGNSAGEIAIDLVEHGAEVSMAVRGPVNITRKELLGIPILAVSIPLSKLPVAIADAISLAVMRLIFGDAPRYGLQLSRKGAFSRVRDQRRTPLIDIGTMALIRRGQIRILPGIQTFGACEIEFTDGRKGEFDAVVAATGYRPTCESLFDDATMFDDGLPRPGAAAAKPGLYFTGFNVSPTGTLYQVSREARSIANAIAVSI